jgi:hypothetical protein
MLEILTVLIMLLLAFFYAREGLFTAFTMALNVFVAGLVAFNFWEPIANRLEPAFTGIFLEGYEDALCLAVLFCLTLGILRLVTNNLANRVIEFPALGDQVGGAAFGLVTGYLIAGFFICMLQMLPWHESFLGFEWKGQGSSPVRRFLPPDHMWLALMRHAGAYPLANQEDDDRDRPGREGGPYDDSITFDQTGTFEIRYERYRRYGDRRDKLPYNGELDRELHRQLSP